MPVNINIMLPESTQLALLSDGAQELNSIYMSAGGSPAIMVSKDGELCSADGEGQLVDLTPDALAAMLRVVCVPVKPVKDKTGGEGGYSFDELPCIPRPLVRAYIETRHWTGIPKVKQVARAPIVRPDYTIRWNTGYDELTQCWVTKGLTKDTTLVDAKFDIRRIFKPFPFLDRRLVADAIAAGFTPLLSTAVHSALPAMIVSARKPASGKTELAKFCSMIGNGGKTITTWRGATELEKMIGTYVTEDNRVVIFDNIKSDIDSTIMESVITSRAISYRKMYSHRSTSLRSNTSWFMTANGAIASEDMVRRSIVIMLDKERTPGLIEWTEDVPSTVERLEAQLVTLMCSMIEDWRDAGCVRGSVIFSGFEEWSGVVSGILECAGIGGMWEMREEIAGEAIQTDDEDDVSILEAIADVMGGREWTSGELWETVNDPMEAVFAGGKAAAVRHWLASVKNVSKNSVKPSIPTGRALHSLVGRKFTGCDLILEARAASGRKKFYSVKRLDGTELPLKGSADSSFGSF